MFYTILCRVPTLWRTFPLASLKVETGSLYPALYRLEAKGWIAASWDLSDKGKRARYYRITPRGRKQLVAEHSKWEAFARAMGLLLKPGEEEGR